MSEPSKPELDAEARAALRLIPLGKEIAAEVKAKLPEGTHWGVLILIPGQPEGRSPLAKYAREQRKARRQAEKAARKRNR